MSTRCSPSGLIPSRQPTHGIAHTHIDSLADIPRLKGVPFLEPGTPIYVEDLEAWKKKAGIKVSAGDALFVRTGVWARRTTVGPWLRGRAQGGRSAGLDPSEIREARSVCTESIRARAGRRRDDATIAALSWV
jgi:hypothetical protein